MRRHGSNFVFYDKSAGPAATAPEASREATGYPVPKKPLKRRYGATFSIFDDFAGSTVESGHSAESGLAVAPIAATEASADADAAPEIFRVTDHDTPKVPEGKKDEATSSSYEHILGSAAAPKVSTNAGPDNSNDAAPESPPLINRNRRKIPGKSKYGSTFVFHDKSAGPDAEPGPAASPADSQAPRHSSACKKTRKPVKRRYGSTFSIFDDFTNPAVVPDLAPEVLREDFVNRKEPERSEDDESELPPKPKSPEAPPRTVSADRVPTRRSPRKISPKSPDTLQ